MSSKQWIFRLEDILKAIEKIERYTGDVNLTKFKQNELVIDAVVRNFEIIGEASKGIPLAVQNSYPHIPWKQMKGMRDVLIHEYASVDIKVLWGTLKKDLPALQKQLKALIKSIQTKS